MALNLEAHWANGAYSDAECDVMLHKEASSVLATTVPVHRVILAGASPYFAALFERWHPPKEATTPDATAADSRRTVPRCVLHVSSPEDVNAALCLLRCCYTGRFDAAMGDSGSAGAAAALGPGNLANGSALLQATTAAATDATWMKQADKGQDQGGGDNSADGGGLRCWQQLAVRTLVLADRLDCPAAVEACIAALSGRLFAHQMSLDAAMAVLWLLPEPLACQEVVAPLRHMARVRVVQEFGDLDTVLADPARTARLQQLPAEALEALLQSRELRTWHEGAVLAAVDAWVAGPVGRASGPTQLAAAGRTVRLPLVAGPLLAAAALMLPEAVMAAWPLEEMGRYHSASLEERYEMTRALLDAGATNLPWSAERRALSGSPSVACVRGTTSLFQLRRLFEQTAAAADRPASAVASSVPVALELGSTAFGGFSWHVAVVCQLETLGSVDTGNDGTDGAAPDAAPAATPGPVWTLGLRVTGAPQLATHGAADSGAESCTVVTHPLEGQREYLFAVGAAKAAAAAARQTTTGTEPSTGNACATEAASTEAAAAHDITVGLSVSISEHVPSSNVAPPAAGATSSWSGSIITLRLPCLPPGGGAPCVCPAGCSADACGLCRYGTLASVPLPGMLPRPVGPDGAADGPQRFLGWQPEVWSAIAPGGQLQWLCSLRIITDY